MLVIDNTTKIVSTWADTEINQQRAESGSLGVVIYEGEVEQGYDGLLYAKGYAPTQSQEEIDAQRAEEIKQALRDIDTHSARAMRAIINGTATEEDRDYLAQEEAKAIELRAELTALQGV